MIEVNAERRIHRNVLPFDELFKLHGRRVYAVCFRMTGNSADAEDLTQEVFVQVFRALDSFRGEASFTTWLHRLTVNQVLMHFRKKRSRREHLTEDGQLPEQSVGRSLRKSSTVLDRLALDEAILKLSPGYRAVFILHDIEGLNHLEIANVLGSSVGTTKSQLHKARMKLRKLLRQRARPRKAKTAIPTSPIFACYAPPSH